MLNSINRRENKKKAGATSYGKKFLAGQDLDQVILPSDEQLAKNIESGCGKGGGLHLGQEITSAF